MCDVQSWMQHSKLFDLVLSVPPSDLSCWRVSAFQELLCWKEKQCMLEMQTRAIVSIEGTADEKYIQEESIVHAELDCLYAL